ncbi:hypothetical protein BG004_003370 [Podila humilis]|nr:hypothetical protein BG004_003370 [Podila humilis]
MSFKEFAAADEHNHPSFEKMFSCYQAFIGRNVKYGNIQEPQVDMEQCRQEFRIMLLQGSFSVSRVAASEFVNASIQDHTEEAMCLRRISKANETSVNLSENVGSASNGSIFQASASVAPGYPALSLKDLEQEPGPSHSKRKNNTQNTIAELAKKKKKPDETFAESARRSLQRRHSNLGPKWSLASGTIVEDVLLQAGLELTVDHPIRSFMIDLQDKYTESLFSPQDWTEVKANLPSSAVYSKEAATYLDALKDITQDQDIVCLLERSPRDPGSAIVHNCVSSWCDMFKMDPSPFALESILSEDWWMNNAWTGTRKLTNLVPGAYIVTGEATGMDSTSRKNNKEREVNFTPQNSRKKMGARADLIWRNMVAPVRDWMIGEAARQWDENANKYVQESTFKVPRQLHDILTARSLEVGGAHRLRRSWVSGAVFGGPVVQRVGLCWGTKGTNVTRLKRWAPARVYPSVKQLPRSLNAARQLLLLRAQTLRFIEDYDQAEEEDRKEKWARCNQPEDDDDWEDPEWRDLLGSSP